MCMKALTALLVVLFWAVAALLAAALHRALDPFSPGGAAVAVVLALSITAFVYMRLVGTRATVDHALGVGIAWFTLAIVAEMAIGGALGRPWEGLLGSSDHPLLRMLFLFAWIFMPSLFARYRNFEGDAL